MLKQIFSKQIISVLSMLTFMLIFGSALAVNVNAEVTADDLFGGKDVQVGDKTGAEAIKQATGLGDEDPREIAANVINVVLGFLGIIAVLLILAGGFRWMTAQGNDEAISGAKNLMIAGVVGLVIILAAFGIARFVVDALVGATT